MKKYLVVLALVFVFSQLQLEMFAQNGLPVLELNTPIEETIKVGETKSFLVNLEKDKYARIISHQIGISSFVRVYKPSGEVLLEEKNLIESAKPNRILLVAETAGDYKIEIIPVGRPNQSGNFKLIWQELRDKTPQDAFLLDAQKTLLEAEKLHVKRDAQSKQQALAKYEEALQLWKKSGDLIGQADAYSYSGIILFSFGRLLESLEKTTQARLFYNKAGDKISEATAFRGIGLIHHYTSNLDKALEFYKKGLAIQRSEKNEYGAASDLGNIGGVYQFRGEFQKALEYYRESLKLSRKFADKGNESRLLNNMGHVFRLLSENEKALEYLKNALRIRQARKNKRGQGNTLNNLGLVYIALEDYSNASTHFNRSLKIRREIGDKRGEATSLNNIGFTQYKLGDYQNALTNSNQSLTLRKLTKDVRGESATHFTLGQINQALGKTDDALAKYQQALDLSRKFEYRTVETAALKSIADIELEKGNLEKAEKLIQEAIEIAESMRSSVAMRSLRTSFLASKQSYYKLYIDILMKKHQANPNKGFNLQALKVSEKSRARELAELLTESQIQITKGVDPSLITQRDNLQVQINTKERQRARLVGRKGAEKSLATLEKDLFNLFDKYEDVKTQIRTKNPDYAQLIEPKTLEIKEIQNLLDEDSILLEYSLGKKQSYVWVINKNSAKSYTLPKKEKINETARHFYDLLTKRNKITKDSSTEEAQKSIAEADKKFNQVATDLSKMLLQPFAKNLNEKRLIVIGDDYLQYVPFGALTKSNVIPKAKYKPLILDHEIVNLSSASTLAILRDRNKSTKTISNSVAVIADPVFSESDARVKQSIARLDNKPKTQNVKLNLKPDDSLIGELKRSANDLNINEFRRLRFSRREANDITSFVPKSKSLKAIDFNADRDLIMNGSLSQYQILHFATHGLLNNKNPELSGIVLSLVDERGKSKEGFLRLHEIYNMQIGADLVVLSACQTALGKNVQGEGLISLTRGFMYAGAESIVASLWQVEDRATAELMKKLYRAMLKDGQKPAAALRIAKMEMIKEGRWENPYYWAAFTLQGEWR